MRRDAEIEGIKTRLVTFEETVKSLRDEMKEYRETLARFKGLEAVLGMSEEARSNIVRIQQLRDQVEIAFRQGDDSLHGVPAETEGYHLTYLLGSLGSRKW
jgi:uncharacterized coiled-coil DUF342 family protein